ncbi:hypothetical protein K501DRAFT_194855 [Backusella circina FSU 941]|nr:hypothetical protein K501DRAFT_194855 [Backusella circina FSU 941]
MPLEIAKENLRGSYKKHTDREYWGVYYSNKAGHGPSVISVYVGMNRDTIKSIPKNIRTHDSPLSLKRDERPKKLDEKAERHVERLIREDPFITYRSLLFYLEKGSIKVLRATIIACIQSVGFGSYCAAYNPFLTDTHENWTED